MYIIKTEGVKGYDEYSREFTCLSDLECWVTNENTGGYLRDVSDSIWYLFSRDVMLGVYSLPL
jgi:hypothetical protein